MIGAVSFFVPCLGVLWHSYVEHKIQGQADKQTKDMILNVEDMVTDCSL
jgi:hypothetical protein